MRSYSSVNPTLPHAHSSTTREFDYAPISSKTSGLESHHAPSSKKNTLFHYAPLSSTTSPSHSLHHAPSPLSSSTESPPHFYFSVHTRQSISSISTSLATASTTLAPTQPSAHTEPLPSGPSVGLAVVVLALLGILMTVAVTIWLVELQGQKHTKKAGHNEESSVVNQPENVSGGVGLGLSLHFMVKGKEEVEQEHGSLNWFDRMTERVVDFAVTRSRTELGSDSEEKLLLRFQKDERVRIKKDRVG